MALIVEMPAMGQSIVEGTVTRWLVRPGDLVERDQPLCVIETDKASSDVPSPAAGRVRRLLVPEGETVPVKSPLCEIADPDEADVVLVDPTLSASSPAAPPDAGIPTRIMQIPTVQPTAGEAGGSDRPRSGAGFASPAVRRLGREHDVDIGSIRGTGRGGRVTRDDILAYIAAHGRALQGRGDIAAPAPTPPVPGFSFTPTAYRIPKVEPWPGDEVQPMSRRRRLIAEHMVYSNLVSPHVATVAEVDLFRVQRRRASLKAAGEVAPGVLAHVAVATVQALKRFPALNSAVDGEHHVLRRDVNLGIAVHVEAGLVVPVVHQADRMDPAALQQAIAELAERAAANRLAVDDLTGGTFTVSNPGRTGNLFGISLINQPQVGILRLGEIVKRPVVVAGDGGDQIVVRPMMYVCLSYDHRVVDGMVGNAFLRNIKDALEAWPEGTS